MIRVTSKDNPSVRRFRALTEKKKERRAAGLFVCEGEKVFREAVAAAVGIADVLLTDDALKRLSDEIAACESAGVRVLSCDEKILSHVSDVENPQGIVFKVKMPAAPEDFSPKDLLVCDEIRDPGNLGTIIRTADAFGCSGVYLVGDCVDVWSPKVVRSCMGSIFRVPILQGDANACAKFCEMNSLRLLVSKPRMDSFAISQGLPPRCAIAVGNEAHGVSQKLEELASGSLYVDMTGGAESLNASVCAGVILWHMQCARREK